MKNSFIDNVIAGFLAIGCYQILSDFAGSPEVTWKTGLIMIVMGVVVLIFNIFAREIMCFVEQVRNLYSESSSNRWFFNFW